MSNRSGTFQLTRLHPEAALPPLNTDGTDLTMLPIATTPAPDTLCGIGRIIANDEVQSVALIIPQQLASEVPTTKAGLVCTEDEINGDVYFHTACEDPGQLAHLMDQRRHMLANLAAFTDTRHPLMQSATTDSAAARIIGQDPETLFFYSGAGLAAPAIWTQEIAAQNANFFSRSYGPDMLAHNRRFVNAFIEDSGVSALVADTYNAQLKQQRRAEPTTAHIAFASLMARLGDKPLVATTIAARMHEATGLVVPHAKAVWPNTLASSDEAEQQFGEQLKARAKDISRVIAIGVSVDGKGIIEYIRQESPDVEVIASNPAQNTMLPYMTRRDMLLRGSAQTHLPALNDIVPATMR